MQKLYGHPSGHYRYARRIGPKPYSQPDPPKPRNLLNSLSATFKTRPIAGFFAGMSLYVGGWVERMAPWARFELAAKRLTVACSTTELPGNVVSTS